MSTKITRRDILKFTGGSILGMMFSPLPWKLLDDSAIWTQNWEMTPKLSHGPISTAFSHCTLCPAGCALQAQCISGMPFSLSGVSSDPISHGILCTPGLAAHHMAYHPLRIVHPHTFSGKSENGTLSAVSLQNAYDAISNHISASKGTIAVLDRQPGRVISHQYQNFLYNTGRGVYLTSPSDEDRSLNVITQMMKSQHISLGYDFENAAMILSFGAPLLDGWGTPGRMTSIRNSHRTSIVQIESRYSRTAMQADRWIALTPGTDQLVALSIASVLEEEKLIPQQVRQSITDYRQFSSFIRNFTPEKTAAISGVDASIIRSLSRELSRSTSAIVLSGADPGGGPFEEKTERAISALNVLLGSVGKSGGITLRNVDPVDHSIIETSRWNSIPDHSIETLIVDGADSGYAIPWTLIERKLVPEKAMVVSLSPILDQFSVHADFLIPSPGHLESLQDIPANSGSPAASFAVSVPLLPKNENTTEPIDVIRELSRRLNITLEIPAHEELLKVKVSEIHSRKHGTIYNYSDGTSTHVSDTGSTDDLWTLLTAGAVWIDEPTKQTNVRSFTLALSDPGQNVPDENSLQLIATGWRGATSSSQISPIMSKVFQETELRKVNGTVSINPVTAHKLGVTNERPATLSTKNGSASVTITFDPAVRPGYIEATIGPSLNGTETPTHPVGNSLLHLCEVTNDGTWRITPAQFLKV